MSSVHWLILVFLVVPLTEVYLLLEVGSIIGAIPTIGLVIFTAVLGGFLMRLQGFQTLMAVRMSLEKGEIPALALVEGAVILVAGALLLTPGFVTDAVGFACLAPRLRRFVIRRLGTGIEITSGGHRVIEGEYRREQD